MQPEPDPFEVGPITADAHLHAGSNCGAFGNGLPGAEVTVGSLTRGELGRGVVDPDIGSARIGFSATLNNSETLQASQMICGIAGPTSALPFPNLPRTILNLDRHLPTPVIQEPLYACERGVCVEGVSEGAIVRLFRDGVNYASVCFDYSRLWFRIGDPLKARKRIDFAAGARIAFGMLDLFLGAMVAGSCNLPRFPATGSGSFSRTRRKWFDCSEVLVG